MNHSRAGMRNFYSASLEKIAAHAQVGWESQTLQRYRFAALIQAVDESWFKGARRSLLDLGCGFGALVDYLEERGIEVDYLGVDLLPEMIERAQAEHPERQFLCKDILELEGKYDMVLASGTLSLAFGDPEDSWALIEKMRQLAGQVLTFNVQSTRGIQRPGASALRRDFWYVDPVELLQKLRRESPDLVIREDVLPSDLFVYLYPQPYLPRSGYSALERAEIALQKGALGQAKSALDEVGDGERDSSWWTLHGVILAHSADPQAAVKALRRACEEDPSSYEALLLLLHMLLAEADLYGARELLKKLEPLAANAAQRDELRIEVHEALIGEDLEAAKAVEGHCETGFAQDFLAGARHLYMGRHQAAQETLQRAQALSPGDGRPLRLLAAAEMHLGLSAQALEKASLLLKYSPNDAVARELALELMRQLKREAKRGNKDALEALRQQAQHPVLGPVAKSLFEGSSVKGRRRRRR